MKEYIFTYQTKCKCNGKMYIGVHKTDNMGDGYIGCGVYSQAHVVGCKKYGLKSAFHNAVLKYGYENFVCKPLDFFDTWDEALEEESKLVDRDWVEDDENYNITTGGIGGSNVCTTQEEEDIIFDKFMSGMKKEDIADEHDISVSVIYRITKDRDTSDRTIPIQSRTEEKNKWIKQNKQKYIERYRAGETQESLNKEAPYFLINTDIFKNVKQDPKYVCITKNGIEIKFRFIKEICNKLNETFYSAGIRLCANGEMSHYKDHLFIYYEDYKNGKRTNGYEKSPTHYKGSKLYKNGKEYIIKTNLSEFCRKYNVEFSAIQRLLNNKQNSSYGFTNNKNDKVYKHAGKIFIKEGKEYKVDTTLKSFANKHNLNAPNLHRLIKGNANQHKGFKYYG